MSTHAKGLYGLGVLILKDTPENPNPVGATAARARATTPATARVYRPEPHRKLNESTIILSNSSTLIGMNPSQRAPLAQKISPSGSHPDKIYSLRQHPERWYVLPILLTFEILTSLM